jgi:hypothetical protein
MIVYGHRLRQLCRSGIDHTEFFRVKAAQAQPQKVGPRCGTVPTLHRQGFRAGIELDVDFLKHPDVPTNTGQSILAFRVDAFCLVEVFKRNVDVAVRTIRESQRLPRFDRIWLPGEQSHAKRVERLVLGIPIPPTLHENLDELARELGIDPII